MPITASKTTGGLAHAPVFVGEIVNTDVVNVVVTALTTNEIDTYGFLKPGVPFAKDGTTVGASEPVWGVTIEAIKVAASNSSADIAAASTAIPVAVGFGLVNRDIAEDNLGRAYTANEIAGFDLAGSNCRITRT